MAEQVMGMPEVQRQPEEEPVQTVITPLVQRQIDEEIEEEGFLQTKESSGQSPEVTPSISSRIQGLRGGGQPLPESVRAYFEPRFGHDFSQVRVQSYHDVKATLMEVTSNAATQKPDEGEKERSDDTKSRLKSSLLI